MRYLTYIIASFTILMTISFSAVDKYQIISKKINSFSLKEACTFMGHKHVLLASRKSDSEVDCMGETMDVNHFCQKRMIHSSKLLGGKVDLKTGRILCNEGDGVQVSISCKGHFELFCNDSPVQSCQKIQAKYALKLYLVHQSIIEKSENKKVLNCYYSSTDL